MSTEETHALGYARVDGDPNAAVLVSTMQQTAGWDATRRLRSWERDELRLARGQRLLDVGCGLGEAALALAEELGDGGEIAGIDASEEMHHVARSHAGSAPCRVRFTVGDATALDEPDGSFDAARSERTLQWLADPAVAVAEIVRVLRPGGRVSLIDTDWSTFRIDVGDDTLSALIRDAMQVERGRASNVGRRLHGHGGGLRTIRRQAGDADLDGLGPRRVPGADRLLLDGEPRRRPGRERPARERRPAAVRVDDPRCGAWGPVRDAPHDVRRRRRRPTLKGRRAAGCGTDSEPLWHGADCPGRIDTGERLR